MVIGDIFFSTPKQGSKLPQEEGKQFVLKSSVYSFSFNPTATNQITYNVFNAVAPTQGFVFYAATLKVYCYATGGNLKLLGNVVLTVLPSFNPGYPAGLTLTQTFNGNSFNGWQASGDPQNNTIKIDVPGGQPIFPNQNVTVKIDFIQGAAFVATDTIVGNIKIDWAL
jgi:hypothetical protein